MSEPLDSPRALASPSSSDHRTPGDYGSVKNAAEEIVALMLETYADGSGKVYGETAIAAAAALAGEFALRATGLPLPPPGALAVGGVQDGILFADPTRATAWSMITRAAGVAGVAALPDLAPIIIRTLGAVGTPRFPPLTIPPQYLPREPAFNAGPRLRATVRNIGERQRLSPSDLVVVLGWAVGSMIIRTRLTLPPAIMIQLAAEIMIAASRVGPLDQPAVDRSRAAVH